MPRVSIPAQPSLPVHGTHATRSNAYHAAMHQLERFARDDTTTVLLQGETGTGKTSLARRIHARSPRDAGPFHTIVLSAMDDGVASSELFGHVVGAFTDARHTRAGHFASAHRGTLFLDEIGKASLALQARLLHAIEYKEITPVGTERTVSVDVRIIAATNLDLATLVDEGRFLPDLYARIEHFRVIVPPLRERRADIPALALDAVRRHAAAAGYASPPEIDEELLGALCAASWPHNLRELDGAMHRILIDADGALRLTLGHCSPDLSFVANPRRRSRHVTDQRVAEVLRQAGNWSEAARVLGIDRKTLRLRANGISPGTPQGLAGK